MKIVKFFLWMVFVFAITPCFSDSLFSENAPVQDGINVFEVSDTFADIYEKLDSVNWAGKNIDVAIESLEKLNPHAHIAATNRRIILVWKDSIVANYPRPEAKDWKAFGEITTALILKFRENDPYLHSATSDEIYQAVVGSLLRGIDENGKYIFSQQAELSNDGRILTSLGIEGKKDDRGNYRVTGVYKDSPADIAGIKGEDLIVQINGMATIGLTQEEIADFMSGFNSGTVKMKLLTPTGNKDVVLRRATVMSTDADIIHRKIVRDGAILEIIVHKVSENAAEIIKEALNKYDDLTGVILDLRAATGDDERAAAKLAGLFIGGKPVMRIVETAGKETEIVPGSDAITNLPTVVLTSDMTRGTAEAIAAAFYEYERGVLVGTPTAGSAKIASRLELKNGGALEVLNKSIKTGTGRKIEGRGVYPLVCLSNIRSTEQQNVFFLNVINNYFNAQDLNKRADLTPQDVRRGCPRITSGSDEDAIALAVSVKILTDDKVYDKLIME